MQLRFSERKIKQAHTEKKSVSVEPASLYWKISAPLERLVFTSEES